MSARWEDVDTLWRVEAKDCCYRCERHDGKVLSLEELTTQVMPLGGPMYGCIRPGQCACTAMPTGSSSSASPGG